MARVLLDTQAIYLAFRNENHLTPARRSSKIPTRSDIISSVSITEIAVKFSIGKLEMNRDDMLHAIA